MRPAFNREIAVAGRPLDPPLRAGTEPVGLVEAKSVTIVDLASVRGRVCGKETPTGDGRGPATGDWSFCYARTDCVGTEGDGQFATCYDMHVAPGRLPV